MQYARIVALFEVSRIGKKIQEFVSDFFNTKRCVYKFNVLQFYFRYKSKLEHTTQPS